jgi:ribosomal protein S18 acetylase RimI-like enzyme
MADRRNFTIPERIGDRQELNYGSPAPADYGPLARDRIPMRSMTERDLAALVAIDRRITGRDRTEYFTRKLREALYESGVRVSLVAEADARPVGFIMARVNLGEFGRTEPTAEMDTIGIDPDYRDRGIGRALLSQLFANLGILRVDKILTEVDWSNIELMAFLSHCDFKPSARLAFDHTL